MSSVAGELLIDLAVQCVVPFLLREATSLAIRPATGEKAGPGFRGHPQPEPLRLLPPARPAVISQTPGRVRLRVEGLRGDATREARLAAPLRDLAGVRLVRANCLTGTVLVEYDPRRIGVRDLLTALEWGEISPASTPTVRRESQRKVREDYQLRLVLVGA